MVKIKSCVFISGTGTNLKALIQNSRSYNFPINIKLVISDKKNAVGLKLAKKYSIASKIINPKDNLFELIMLRLEHMEIYKKALKKIIADLDQNPLPLKKVLITVTNSLDFYLELAGAYDNSFFDIFRIIQRFIV